MGKITGYESTEQIPPKVLQMYSAVFQLIAQGADISTIRVSNITEQAGIGKGTAYEYFDTKEDIVSCAIIYHMRIIFEGLNKVLMGMESFEQQLDYLLDEMSKNDGRKVCFLRFVHTLTDNSDFCQSVQNKLQSKNFEEYMPVTVFSRILKRAVERGEVRKDLPIDYMVYSIFAHLTTYMLAVATEDHFKIQAPQMRPYVRQGILNELCEKNK